MIIAAVVVALLAGFIVSVAVDKTYSSSIDFMVRNGDSQADYTTTTYLDASEQLINNYVDYIRSDKVLEPVVEKLVSDQEAKALQHYLDAGKTQAEAVELSKAHAEKVAKSITPNVLRSMISAGAKQKSSVFTIKISGKDPAMNYAIAQAIEELAPRIVTEIEKDAVRTAEQYAPNVTKVIEGLNDTGLYGNLDVDKFTVEKFLKDNTNLMDYTQLCFVSINSPVLDQTPDAPNVARYAILSGAVAAILVYAIFFIRGLLHMEVSSEDDVKRLVKYPIIATIPRWEAPSKK